MKGRGNRDKLRRRQRGFKRDKLGREGRERVGDREGLREIN